MIQKLKKRWPLVLDILLSKPKTRDKDILLYKEVYKYEIKALGLKNPDFFKLMEQGKVSNFETIGRIRRLLNQKCPDTRGASYKPRKKAEKKVRKEITKLTPYSRA